MMADDYDLLLWIKFLNPCRNVLHGNVGSAFNVRCLILPRLATVEKRKVLSSITHALQLFGLNLVVHSLDHSLQCCSCRHFPGGGVRLSGNFGGSSSEALLALHLGTIIRWI